MLSAGPKGFDRKGSCNIARLEGLASGWRNVRGRYTLEEINMPALSEVVAVRLMAVGQGGRR